jgi:hypothetical protein
MSNQFAQESLREMEKKRNAFWRNLVLIIIIPIILSFFVWRYLIYLIPLGISIFCATNRLPPSVPSKPSGDSFEVTKLPDLPGTRVLAQIKCPHCGKMSDSGNVYCPYCQNTMKKKVF